MPFRMRSWRSDRTLGRAAAGAALLLALWAPPAPAQLGPPVRLQTPPGAGTGPTIPPPPATGVPTPDESIKATPLAPEDAAWIGALESQLLAKAARLAPPAKGNPSSAANAT